MSHTGAVTVATRRRLAHHDQMSSTAPPDSPAAPQGASASPGSHQAVLERELDGRPDEVFASFVDAGRLRDWLSGEGEATADAKVGGTLTILMRLGGGSIRYEGQYLRIEPPDTVAFTWRVDGDKESSVVRVQLAPAAERRTRLTLVHGGLRTARLARDYELAWQGFLGILAHQLEAQVGWKD